MNATYLRRHLARTALRNGLEPIQVAHRIRTTPVRRCLSQTSTQHKDDEDNKAKDAEKKKPGRQAGGPVQMGPGTISLPSKMMERWVKADLEATAPPKADHPLASRPPGVGRDRVRYRSPMKSLDAILGGKLGKTPGEKAAELRTLTESLHDSRLRNRLQAVTMDGVSVIQAPYNFHVYSHKHNTHVTVTKPDRNSIISLSCGNIGFRKSRRKSYDAAYQLTTTVLKRLYDAKWDTKINKMEVVLRGFGPGREAATKVLLGNEGEKIRDKIIRVSDATRIKFGGTKSKNKRRI